MRRTRSRASTRSMWNWQSSSCDPSSCGAADPDHPLPLAPHGEDRINRREDAQPLLLEVVLQALEDERRVGRVRLDDRHLAGRAVASPLVVVRVADRHVQPGQPFVQLEGGRHGPRDETEVPADPLGQRLRRQLQRQRVGHPS